jgi:steroid delta-isomerase-like uncharacterized protein
MSIEENKQLVLRYTNLYENLESADEILAPDFIDHSHSEFRPGTADIIQNLIDFHNAFSYVHGTVEDMIGEGDTVAFRFTLTGTHTGTYAGIPATGKEITLTGMDFVRIRNGKIAELWSNQDALGMLRQLDVIRFETGHKDSEIS